MHGYTHVIIYTYVFMYIDLHWYILYVHMLINTQIVDIHSGPGFLRVVLLRFHHYREFICHQIFPIDSNVKNTLHIEFSISPMSRKIC